MEARLESIPLFLESRSSARNFSLKYYVARALQRKKACFLDEKHQPHGSETYLDLRQTSEQQFVPIYSPFFQVAYHERTVQQYLVHLYRPLGSTPMVRSSKLEPLAV